MFKMGESLQAGIFKRENIALVEKSRGVAVSLLRKNISFSLLL